MTEKMQGADGLKEAFEGLNDEVVQGKVAWGAVRKGAAVIKDKIIQNYHYNDPSTPLNISDFVAVQRASRMAKKGKVVAYRVGIQGTAVTPRNPEARKNPESPYYWRMIEFGTRSVAARPFVRPAAEQSTQKVFSTVADAVWAGIGKAIKKRSKGK